MTVKSDKRQTPKSDRAGGEKRSDRLIAAVVTMAVALALLLFLFFGSMDFDRAALSQASVPEIQDEEELFLGPEILQDLGEEEAVNRDEPAPVIQGEPEKAETENTKIVEPGENPKPAPPREKLNTTKRESKVKATEPSVSKEEKKRVTSSMADKFSGKNGASTGSSGSAGAGGTGVGISGNANGRNFLGCSTPQVELRHKTTVKVSVVIDAEGKVTSASASGGASASIRRACERAARTARWSAKKGVGETRGTITFTITPK